MRYAAMSKTFFSFLLLFFMVGQSMAVEVKHTPVQAMMADVVVAPQPQMLIASSGNNLPFGSASDDSEESEYGRKSGKKAALLSALLPGLGEYYVGQKKKATYFFAVEALGWISFLGFRTSGSWREDDYLNLACDKAGIDLEGREEWMLDYVSFYDDIYIYNELGRALDRNRPYLPDNDANHWVWASAADKEAFRDLKNGSKESYRRANFTLGALLLTRIVSVIDAIHAARKTGKRLDDLVGRSDREYDYTLEAIPIGNDIQLNFALIKRF